MRRIRRFSFKKLFILVGQGVAIALLIALVVYVFRDFFKAHINVYIVKVLMTSVVLLAKIMTFVFIIGGILMALIIHWVGWENIKFRIKQSRYRSFLYAKDYYNDYKRVKYENFVGDLTRFHDKKLETGGPEIDEALVGPARTSDKRGLPGQARGTRDGVVQTYHSNGMVESEISYKNGILHGPYVTYYPSGRMHNEKFYMNGKLNGTFKAWDEDGHLFFEINYQDDKQHGVDKIYNRSGALQFEDTYVDGKRVRRKTFDEGGKLKFIQDYH